MLRNGGGGRRVGNGSNLRRGSRSGAPMSPLPDSLYPDENVCIVVGSGVVGVDSDCPGEGGGGVKRGDPDGVGDGAE